MSVALVDDTLPLSNQATNQGGSQGGTQGRAANGENGGDAEGGNNGEDAKEMHVPSVTLVMFSKDRSKLPVVRSAGDVICCEKVR